jgi:hypothetical protein
LVILIKEREENAEKDLILKENVSVTAVTSR